MANYCNYEMKVISSSKENLQEFFKRLKTSNYEHDENYDPNSKHYFRIFEASIVDEDGEDYKHVNDKCWSSRIGGFCAWSVSGCMLPTPFSYYTYWKEINDKNRGKFNGTNGTNLLLDSEELDLEIEVFSEESGEGFMEHYIVKNGKLIVDEVFDYNSDYNEATGEWEYTRGIEWEYNI